MRIAVLGANGRTGREVVQQALARGWEVSALVRDSSGISDLDHPLLRVVEGDSRRDTDVTQAVTCCDAVVSTLGSHGGRLGPLYGESSRVLVRTMTQALVSRLVVLSSRSLGETAAAADAADAPRATSSEVLDDLRDMERTLAQSSLEWTIMRPARLVSSPIGDYDTLAGAVFPPGRETRRADLAEAMLTAIDKRLWIREAVAIVSR